MEQEENKQTNPSWRQVNINPEIMPLNAMIEFLNILNQRLSTIEDTIIIPVKNGEETTQMSITEFYAMQNELAQKKGE